MSWLLLCVLLPRLALAGTPGGEIAAGSYCTLPEPGQKPACLAPARAEHPGFFNAVDGGEVDEVASSRLEDVLRNDPGSPDAYLALSSLAYGYMQLAHSAAAAQQGSPVLTARLERWNALISQSYAEQASPDHFKSALLEAARDIQAKVAGLGATCIGGDSASGECSTGLVEALEQIDSHGPIRDPMRGILDRLLGTEPNP